MLVKVSIEGAPPRADISQFLGNDRNRLDGLTFAVNDAGITEADVWIVIEAPDPNDLTCLANRTVFVAAESMWGPGREAESPARQQYLTQFDTVYTYQDLYWPRVQFAPPFLPWMINANHGASIFSPHTRDVRFFRNLRELPKRRPLSVICSTKTYTEGHRLRLRFVEALATELGDDLDWFGNGHLSVPEKWDAIAPYRFHLVIENQSAYGVITEKLIDSFLGLAHPIYYGAPDATHYFPEKAITSINIRDFSASLAAIKNELNAPRDSDADAAIIQAKDIALRDWNLFERLGHIAKFESRLPKRRHETLLRLPHHHGSILRRMAGRMRLT